MRLVQGAASVYPAPMNFVAVAIGGAVGSVARYALSLALRDHAPWGTFAANAVGSLLLAMLTVWTLSSPTGPGTATRLMLTTGLCGGFTTYSTFNLEALRMLQEGQVQRGVVYLVVTLVTCLAAGACGWWLARGLWPAVTTS